jgi:hypothetical protein
MRNTLAILLLLIQFDVFGQTSFQFSLEYPGKKSSSMAINDGLGGIIVPITDFTGADYSYSTYIKGYLLCINSAGDTLTHRYSFHDTSFHIQRMLALENNGYMLFGGSRPPGTEHDHLLIMKIDDSFNLLWAKHYPNPILSYGGGVVQVFTDSDSVIIAAARCNYPCNLLYPYLVKIDENGNIIRSILHYSEVFRGRIYDFMYSSQNGNIWLFMDPNSANYAGNVRGVFNAEFEYLHFESFPDSSRPWPSRLKTSWTPDSLILMSYIKNRTGAQDQDDEIWLAKYDTSLNMVFINSFGTADTMDNTPFVGAGAASIHPDTIYFAGYKHKTLFQPNPGMRNWIVAGQTDGQLQPRFVHYIGGDQYYETRYMLATSDGGFVIQAAVFNHQTSVYDLLFLKLNNEGLITGNNQKNIPVKRAFISPNPAAELLRVDCLLPGAQAEILSLTGTTIGEFGLNIGSTLLPLHQLKPGIYLLGITLPGEGIVETHKFVKL